MNQEYLMKCYESLRQKVDFKPEIAVVLGSGLGDYAESIEIVETLPYSEIEGFPVSTISGHKGQFVFGYENGVPVVIMQGRVHYYEGYTMEQVVLPIYLMKLMGAKVLFLTNAAGGVNESFAAGDFMLISDQISSFIPSPLIGPNLEEFGTRFPDMSEVYVKSLRALVRESAKELQIELKEGVYLQFTGPAYESPAEIRMSRVLGADAVGMSTVCEAIVANQIGMQICGISCITNMACGILEQPLDHTEVKETADRVAPLFKQLVKQSLIKIYAQMKSE
jgi:purine nucleoside phosphorylase I, inosine and guanosine-specific